MALFAIPAEAMFPEPDWTSIGLVMATVGYLKTNPSPSRQELAHGISGNLCRCQDYDKILTAMMRGAELLRG